MPFNFIFQVFSQSLLSCSNFWLFLAWDIALSWGLFAQTTWGFLLPSSGLRFPSACITHLLLVTHLLWMTTRSSSSHTSLKSHPTGARARSAILHPFWSSFSSHWQPQRLDSFSRATNAQFIREPKHSSCAISPGSCLFSFERLDVFSVYDELFISADDSLRFHRQLEDLQLYYVFQRNLK